MNNLEFVREFINKMNTQDNRCTAAPYFYQIEYEQEVPTHRDYADGWHWLQDNETYSTEEAFEYLELNLEEYSESEIEDALNDGGFTKVYYLIIKKYTGLFLTEEDAENHLRLNRYHYGPNARTYIFHAWRAPQLKQFLESVAILVGTEYKPRGSF